MNITSVTLSTVAAISRANNMPTSRARLSKRLPVIGFKPDIIHVNDWHTAMIPMLLKTQYDLHPQGKCKTVLVHP